MKNFRTPLVAHSQTACFHSQPKIITVNSPTKNFFPLSTVAALLASSSLCQGATFLSVGVYDENGTEPNTVDTDIGGTLGSFTADVLNAFNNNRGGVINFQSGFTNSGSNTVIGTTFDVDYGAAASKTLALSSTSAIEIWHNDTAGQVDTISDNNNLLPTTNATTFTLSLGAITGGEPGEVVSEIGLTVLSRSVWGTSPDVNITANFSGGGSSVLTSSISNSIGNDDTFYHFVAPTGESIISLDFDNSTGGGNANQNRIPVDDLAFITSVPTAVIPEPSGFLMVCLGSFFTLMRRRRR